MNKLTIIGNLTQDPVQRSTPAGDIVTTYTVAVNRRSEGADYFRVSTWNKAAEACAKYLRKGKKVCVVGSVSLNTYTGQDGKTHASMEVTSNEVEFLSAKDDAPQREDHGGEEALPF